MDVPWIIFREESFKGIHCSQESYAWVMAMGYDSKGLGTRTLRAHYWTTDLKAPELLQCFCSLEQGR